MVKHMYERIYRIYYSNHFIKCYRTYHVKVVRECSENSVREIFTLHTEGVFNFPNASFQLNTIIDSDYFYHCIFIFKIVIVCIVFLFNNASQSLCLLITNKSILLYGYYQKKLNYKKKHLCI